MQQDVGRLEIAMNDPLLVGVMDRVGYGFDEPRGLPTTWLIGPDGKVAKRFVGTVDQKSLGQAIGLGK